MLHNLSDLEVDVFQTNFIFQIDAKRYDYATYWTREHWGTTRFGGDYEFIYLYEFI